MRTAEQRVFDRLRSALAADYRLYPNVRWISKRDANTPARGGETDLLIVHPEHGLLVVETKRRAHPARCLKSLVVGLHARATGPRSSAHG